MRRAAAAMAKMREAEKSFDPTNTLIGVQEIGNRFTTPVAPVKGQNAKQDNHAVYTCNNDGRDTSLVLF